MAAYYKLISMLLLAHKLLVRLYLKGDYKAAILKNHARIKNLAIFIAQTKTMENKDFKVGDVVFLNSGSPQLTINHLNETKTQANLSYWNTVTNRFEEVTFSTEIISLVLYDETL